MRAHVLVRLGDCFSDSERARAAVGARAHGTMRGLVLQSESHADGRARLRLEMSALERCAESYFRPKKWEGRGALYEWLGVRVFKRLLLRAARQAPGSPRRSSYLLQDRSPEAMRAFERRTRRNELVHLAAMGPALLGLVVGGLGSPLVACLSILVVAINFHPLILQRYNRIRLSRALARAA